LFDKTERPPCLHAKQSKFLVRAKSINSRMKGIVLSQNWTRDVFIMRNGLFTVKSQNSIAYYKHGVHTMLELNFYREVFHYNSEMNTSTFNEPFMCFNLVFFKDVTRAFQKRARSAR